MLSQHNFTVLHFKLTKCRDGGPVYTFNHWQSLHALSVTDYSDHFPRDSVSPLWTHPCLTQVNLVTMVTCTIDHQH